MIYLVGLICGLLNGLFASGAGQILVLYLVFLRKLDTYKSRATSVLCLGCVTLFSLISYIKIVNFKFEQILIALVSGMIFGPFGAKLMRKINPNLLNLISGLLIIAFSLYNLIKNW